jgi:hypothetical protein
VLPAFLLGVAVLVGGLLIYRWFVTAEPRVVAERLMWLGLILVGLLIVGLAVSGRLVWALGALPVLLPMALRLWRGYGTAKTFARMAGVGGRGRTSKVDTRYLHMVLDHDTGNLDGTIRDGPYAGRRLESLAEHEVFEVLDACRIDDPQSAQVLEAWLDRTHPDWRDRADGSWADGTGGEGGGATGAAGFDGPMTREQAYAVLGLEPGADDAAIKAAYHRLMASLHPDKGGSNWLAAQLNRARQVLLGR